MKQSNGLCRLARTFPQRVENARLTIKLYMLVSPVLGKPPFFKDLSPFGPAPDVNDTVGELPSRGRTAINRHPIKLRPVNGAYFPKR